MDELEFLERRFGFLSQLIGATFVRELARLLELLENDTRFAPYLADLGREAEQRVSDLRAQDQRMSKGAAKLRNKLIHLAPSADDSVMPEPDADRSNPTWSQTLAWFWRQLAQPIEIKPDTFSHNVGRLLECLQAKAQNAMVGGLPAAAEFLDGLEEARS